MAICIGVTGVASILLWFYFKNRIESVETKLDNMFNMIQNFAQPQSEKVANSEMTDYYQQGGQAEDPFENKELQYENQNSSPQLPTEMFEKEIEDVVNNNTKLIEVSEDSGEDSGEDSSEEESGEESEEESEEEIGKEQQMELQKATEDKETDSLDDVDTDDEEEENDDVDDDDNDDDDDNEQVKKVELKEEVKEYSSMKVSELKKLAQTKGLTGYTKLNKAGLVNLLENN